MKDEKDRSLHNFLSESNFIVIIQDDARPIHDEKKCMVQLKREEDDLGYFGTHEKIDTP